MRGKRDRRGGRGSKRGRQLYHVTRKEQKKIERVYANRRWHKKKLKKWLGKLEQKTGGEGSLLGDCIANSYSWDETTQEDARGKIIEEWIVRTGCTIMKRDSRLTLERTREERRESSRINFLISKDKPGWLWIKTRKHLLDHCAIYGE